MERECLSCGNLLDSESLYWCWLCRAQFRAGEELERATSPHHLTIATLPSNLMVATRAVRMKVEINGSKEASAESTCTV
jgi:hypothetical protein